MTAPASLPGKSMVRRKSTAPRRCRQTQTGHYRQPPRQPPRQTSRQIRQAKQLQKQNLSQHPCQQNRTFARYRRLQKW